MIDPRIPPGIVNSLYEGKIEDLLPLIPDESIDCIFADPDYNVGVSYQGKSYTRKEAEYDAWCVDWAEQCRRVLAVDGNLFVLNYPRNNAYLRANYLDSNFDKVREYVWVYKANVGQGPRHFTTAHRTILHCTKSPRNRFYKDAVAVPYENPKDKRIRQLVQGGSPGRMPYSWFEFNLVKNVGRTKTFHSCQIPEQLSEMLFRATTKAGDTVLVLFAGSGAELAVCQRLNLNFISAEISKEYCELIRQRLRAGGEVPEEYRLMHYIRKRKQVTPRSPLMDA